MKLAPFGGEQPFPRPSLSDIIGHLQSLIEMECERTEWRKHGGPLDRRIDLCEKASELLQQAERL